ncbi:DUF72 domain-containing protein [Devosia sp. ZB163]|uniref:DUF72 domain-containing protein n=1 Tax=Devosia sp. ZB163 TaxID=3025938 RepID=UPI0023616772|nr:DUF72 domain-containing protein [Devosia sp. ZB163]MDC9826465.1 DUF72 domain-containing protein [Devosia sp. ZB163]
MAGTIRLGTAGWVFEPWRKNFYPDGLKQREELAYASAQLGNIEINATFYSHQKATSFENWASQTPDDFVFTVKGHQLVTHIKRLKDVEIPLANFFASGVMALGRKLGPFCWQLPGNSSYDPARMEDFLALLPQTPDELTTLAGKTDYAKNPPYLDATGIGRVRHAIEVRHKSFADERFIAQLRRYNVALVVADTADWPHIDQTADFSYARLQGAPGRESYSTDERDARTGWLKAWAEGSAVADGTYVTGPEAAPPPRDVFAFFVSTDKEHAPDNARAVMAMLGLKGPGE